MKFLQLQVKYWESALFYWSLWSYCQEPLCGDKICWQVHISLLWKMWWRIRLLSAVLYKEQIACYSPFLTERLQWRPTNPQHFYLELEANICSNSSLRKPVAVSFFKKICRFFFAVPKLYIIMFLSWYLHSIISECNLSTWVKCFSSTYRIAIHFTEGGGFSSPVSNFRRKVMGGGLLFLSILTSQSCLILLQICELPMPSCNNTRNAFPSNKKSIVLIYIQGWGTSVCNLPRERIFSSVWDGILFLKNEPFLFAVSWAKYQSPQPRCYRKGPCGNKLWAVYHTGLQAFIGCWEQ